MTDTKIRQLAIDRYDDLIEDEDMAYWLQKARFSLVAGMKVQGGSSRFGVGAAGDFLHSLGRFLNQQQERRRV